eukprot:14719333-Ditylum_brightwellii.AAC.1
MHCDLSRFMMPVAPAVMQKTKGKRQIKRGKKARYYLDQLEHAWNDDVLTFSEDEIKKAIDARMELSHQTSVDHNTIVNWLKSNKIEHYGLLAEADQQMVQLEKDNVVDGIISEDGNEIALGIQLMLYKMSCKSNGDYQFHVFERKKFFHPDSVYNSKLCLYPSLITDVPLLLGNDYMDMAHSNRISMVFGLYPDQPIGTRKRKNLSREIKRQSDGLIDMLVLQEDKSK